MLSIIYSNSLKVNVLESAVLVVSFTERRKREMLSEDGSRKVCIYN